MPARANVFTIPASAPFLPTLIGALTAGRLIKGFPASGDPLALAEATLFLPTRRACQMAREQFLASNGGEAAVLPRIVPLGSIDDDEIVFAQAATGALAETALALQPTIPLLERRLVLAGLISKWAASEKMRGSKGSPLVANSPASALALADELARLIDDMTTRGIGWDKLDRLVPEDFDPYWQHTIKFLQIAREAWPTYLAELGLSEPAARRDALIKAEAARFARSNAPVIVAGSTGSLPSTAELIAVVARMKNGAVVLPGLDTILDEASWRAIAGKDDDTSHDGMPVAGHPQFAMHALLDRIGIRRDEVDQSLAVAEARDTLLSEALRPAAKAELWQMRLKDKAFVKQVAAACEGMSVIEAPNAEDEALAIAMALRETLATPGKEAALVTPDRALARRVLAALERWNVPVADSGGDSLADTPAGVFARLAAEVALGGLAPVPLLALLKHPRFGVTNADDIAVMERAVLRGPRPSAGSQGLVRALEGFPGERETLHASDPRKTVTDAQLASALLLAKRLAAALAPLETQAGKERSLSQLTQAHRDALAALGAAFTGVDGQTLAAAFDDFAATTAAASLVIAAGEYAETFKTLMASRVVRRPERRGVRIRILGPLEARLLTIDRVIIGGLNEGVWPPEARNDPWLSRPMRRQLGLNLPELRVGLSAHDFTQAMGAKDVILTRAARLAGAPTVASRFTQRIEALAGEQRWKAAKAAGQVYLDYAHALDTPAAPPDPARQRPAPTPPLEARPTRLSVTDIEHWLRDPYTIYAKHVLALRPLDAVDTPPGFRDRGTIIHEAIGDFTRNFAKALPDNAAAQLETLGHRSFARLKDFPDARAFWWPRFLRIASWFLAWERDRRPQLAAIYGEISGKLEIPLGKRNFTLSARADRIERRKDGAYTIIDYKTGAARSDKQVLAGLAPQLTLEAAILRGGGFKDIASGSVAELAYVTLKGGNPAGVAKPIGFKDSSPDSQADYALKRLTEVARKFEETSQAYVSLVHPMWKTYYGDYDHLARVKEWSLGGADE